MFFETEGGKSLVFCLLHVVPCNWNRHVPYWNKPVSIWPNKYLSPNQTTLICFETEVEALVFVMISLHVKLRTRLDVVGQQKGFLDMFCVWSQRLANPNNYLRKMKACRPRWLCLNSIIIWLRMSFCFHYETLAPWNRNIGATKTASWFEMKFPRKRKNK